jgi:DnaJ-class molecular chaperone
MVEEDWYSVLGVDKKATVDEIKSAYRKLALKYHPDKGGGDPAAERFVLISEAYKTLSNPMDRSLYDSRSETTVEGDGGDLDVYATVELTLEEVAKGTNKTVEYSRMVVCPICSGAGDLSCSCMGKRIITVREKVGVVIPPGAKATENDTLKLPGRGNQSKTKKFGSLKIKTEYLKHDQYTVNGIDLKATLDINIVQLMLKGAVRTKTLYGDINVKITGSQIVKGQVKIPGRGLPNWENTQKGDLFLDLNLPLPAVDKLTDREKKLLELLQNSKNFKTT